LDSESFGNVVGEVRVKKGGINFHIILITILITILIKTIEIIIIIIIFLYKNLPNSFKFTYNLPEVRGKMSAKCSMTELLGRLR
jgi:hypothetical protein